VVLEQCPESESPRYCNENGEQSRQKKRRQSLERTQPTRSLRFSPTHITTGDAPNRTDALHELQSPRSVCAWYFSSFAMIPFGQVVHTVSFAQKQKHEPNVFIRLRMVFLYKCGMFFFRSVQELRDAPKVLREGRWGGISANAPLFLYIT